jgi:hypothetical protein
MKSNPIALVATWMAVSILPVAAQHRPGHGPGRPGPRMAIHGTTAPAAVPEPVLHPGDLSDLSSLKDRFTAFQRLHFQGEAYFSAQDAELQSSCAGVYGLIQSMTVGERLDRVPAWNEVDVLIQIGRKAREFRGEASRLDDTDSAAIRADLAKLAEEVKSASRQEARAATLTPELNRVQWTMDELARFGAGGILSEGKQSMLSRRLEALQAKEDAAKSDGKVTERERQELLDQTREAWKSVVRIFS